MTEPALIYDTKVFKATTQGLKAGLPYIVHQGGTSSGKTFGNLLALFQWCLQSEKPLWVSVVAATLPMLKKGAIKDFNYILNAEGYVAERNKTDNRYKIGVSTIEFFAIDDEGKARGSRRD